MQVIPAVASIAATGLSVMGSITTGQGQKAADDYQAQQQERASQYGYIKAQQTSQVMDEKLQGTLANISAIRASANAGESPTGAALSNYTEYQGDIDRRTSVGNALAQSAEEQSAAAMYSKMGSQALLGGYLGAAGDIFKGLAGIHL